MDADRDDDGNRCCCDDRRRQRHRQSNRRRQPLDEARRSRILGDVDIDGHLDGFGSVDRPDVNEMDGTTASWAHVADFQTVAANRPPVAWPSLSHAFFEVKGRHPGEQRLPRRRGMASVDDDVAARARARRKPSTSRRQLALPSSAPASNASRVDDRTTAPRRADALRHADERGRLARRA